MDNALMAPPKCPAHNVYMILRPGKSSPEANFCGTWYECPYPKCACTALLPSRELEAQLEAMKQHYTAQKATRAETCLSS